MTWSQAVAPGPRPQSHVTWVRHAQLSPYVRTKADDRRAVVGGAVYDRLGYLVPSSQRAGGHLGDLVVSSDKKRFRVPDPPVRLAGRWLYGGNWMGQFGHFVTETLTNFWPEFDDLDGIVCHPFVWGVRTAAWQRMLVNAATGIDTIRVVEVPASVAELIVPSRPYAPAQGASSEAVQVWDRCVRRLDTEARASQPERVFLSRSRLTRAKRRLAGDDELDDAMAAQGFVVVHPQHLGIEEQIRLVRHASVIAGVTGSALHLSAFAGASVRVLEIGDERTADEPLPNQRVIDAARGRLTGFVPLMRSGQGRDVSATIRGVRDLMEDVPDTKRQRWFHRVRDMADGPRRPTR